MNVRREWIGHGEERRDRIEAGLVARWAATLIFVDATHEKHGADGLAIRRAKFPARCPGYRYVLLLGSGDDAAYLLATGQLAIARQLTAGTIARSASWGGRFVSD